MAAVIYYINAIRRVQAGGSRALDPERAPRGAVAAAGVWVS